MRCTIGCRTTSRELNRVMWMPGMSFSNGRTCCSPERLSLMTAAEIDLRQVTCYRHLRPETDTGQKHLHLRNGRVLTFVQNDERFIECPTSHVSERRYLDDFTIDQAFYAFITHHLE